MSPGMALTSAFLNLAFRLFMVAQPQPCGTCSVWLVTLEGLSLPGDSSGPGPAAPSPSWRSQRSARSTEPEPGIELRPRLRLQPRAAGGAGPGGVWEGICGHLPCLGTGDTAQGC